MEMLWHDTQLHLGERAHGLSGKIFSCTSCLGIPFFFFWRVLISTVHFFSHCIPHQMHQDTIPRSSINEIAVTHEEILTSLSMIMIKDIHS